MLRGPTGPKPSDCPPVTDADRALIDETITVKHRLWMDDLARKWTVAVDFADLVHDEGGVSTYRPSLRYGGNGAAERKALADAYDQCQKARNDARRAF